VGSVDKPADCRRVCFSGASAEFTVSGRYSCRFAVVERVRATRLAEWACDTLIDDSVRADHAQLPSGHGVHGVLPTNRACMVLASVCASVMALRTCGARTGGGREVEGRRERRGRQWMC